MATATKAAKTLDEIYDLLGLPDDRRKEWIAVAAASADPEKSLRSLAADIESGAFVPPPEPPPQCSPRECSAHVRDVAYGLQAEDFNLLDALEQTMLAVAERHPIEECGTTHALAQRLLTPEEQRVVAKLGLDNHDLAREYSRCSELLKQKKLAGTPEQRAELRKKAAAANERLNGANSEGAKIQKQLDELNAKLLDIRLAAEAASAPLLVVDTAVATLAALTANENYMVPRARMSGWPEGGPTSYAHRHCGGKEPGHEIPEPKRVKFGESWLQPLV